MIQYTSLMKDSLLTIDDNTYTLVKERNQMPVSIYKGVDCYLRIGPKQYIDQEISYHNNLLQYGFPVPRIITRGQFQGFYYFIETSLGEEHLGQIFSHNCNEHAIVSELDFKKLLTVTSAFTNAQLKTVREQKFDSVAFKEFIKLDILQEELPLLASRTNDAYLKASKNISSLPTVLTHGDFNPYNIFETGVIDWERGSFAPLGYDLVTTVTQSFFFPLHADSEFNAGYRFSKEQIERYWSAMDSLCSKAHIASISSFANDFIFCRAVWSVVRMERWPKIQALRYTQYEALLKAYLNDKNLTDFLLQYDS